MHTSAQFLKLITFDADGTLYADGAHIEHDNEMIRHIIALMRRCATCVGVGGGGGALFHVCLCAASSVDFKVRGSEEGGH